MNPTYSTIEPSSTTNRTIPKSNSDEEALIDASHQSILRATNNLYQSQNTMSPRLPRKRNVANNPNMAKEDDFDNEFEMQIEDKQPLNVISPSVVITPNSPPPRSYSGHDIGSPNNSSGSSYRKAHHWPIEIEREDGPDDGMRRNPMHDVGDDDELHDATETELDEVQNNKKYHRKNGIDVSLYTTKKNVAQGMLDISLLSANCSQLKYLLFHYERDTSTLTNQVGGSAGNSGSVGSVVSWLSSMDFYFIVNLVCISISICLQVIVGILLILNGRHNIYVHRYQRVADSYSNLILITVFIITIVNIFLSVFISAS